jgi:hypothetical protein
MLENRTSERHLVFRTGRISGSGAPGQIDCAVLNVSGSGACILVPEGTAIGDLVQLVIDREDTVRVCRRVWQQGCKVGLTFIDGTEPVSLAAE